MTEIVLKRYLGSAVRHALTFGGGWLTARGLVNEADAAALVMNLVPVLVGIIWSLYEKRWKART